MTYSVILLFCYCVTLLFYCSIALFLYCSITLLLYCSIALLLCFIFLNLVRDGLNGKLAGYFDILVKLGSRLGSILKRIFDGTPLYNSKRGSSNNKAYIR